jgi:hypothetical protein
MRSTAEQPVRLSVSAYSGPVLGVVLFLAALAVGALGVERVAWAGAVRFQAEGQVFGSLLALLRGSGLGSLYPADHWQHAPLVLTQYGPLYFLITAPIMALAGLTASLSVPRAVSVAAAVAVAVTLWVVARRAARPWWQPAVLVGALFMSPPLQNPAVSAQTDMLALAWTVAGILLLLRPSAVSGARAGAALGLFLLAFFTKQSFVAAPAALCLSEIVAGRRRRGMLYAAAFASGAALGIFVLDRVTGGGYLLNTAGSLSVFSPAALPRMLADGRPLSWVPAAALALLLSLGSRRRRYLVVYAALAWAVALVGGFKVGSSSNYFLEPLVALALLGLDSRPEEAEDIRLERVAMPWVQVAVLVSALLGARGLAGQLRERPPAIALEGAARGAPLVSAWAFPAVARTGSRPFLNDTYAFGVLRRAGLWDPAPLRDALEHGRIPYVIPDVDLAVDRPPAGGGGWLGGFWWMPELADPLRSRYRLLHRAPDVWVPRIRGGGDGALRPGEPDPHEGQGSGGSDGR